MIDTLVPMWCTRRQSRRKDCILYFAVLLCVAHNVRGQTAAAKASSLSIESPPPKASTQWRIINLQPVTYGWTIGELRFFSDAGCANELTAVDDSVPGGSAPWRPISSGNDGVAFEDRAFDKLTWTEWRSSCYMCQERDAWLGIEFANEVSVLCVQLWQWGSRDYDTGSVELQRWQPNDVQESLSDEPGAWMTVLKGFGMAGQRWDKVGYITCETVEPPDGGRVTISNEGYYPSQADFECAGVSFHGGTNTQFCLEDGTWTGGASRCWTMMEFMVISAFLFTVELVAFAYYYVAVMGRKSPPLSGMSHISDDSLRSWSGPWWEGFFNKPLRTAIMSILCPCMRLADTWHGAGLVKFYAGIWLPQCGLPFLPCIGAYLRSQIRDRFIIEDSPISDLLMWTFCWPCAAAQEAKHIDIMCEIAEEERVVAGAEAERKKRKAAELAETLQKRADDAMTDKMRLGKSAGNIDSIAAGPNKHAMIMRGGSVLDMPSMA